MIPDPPQGLHMPHGGVTWEPWPHEPPEGWPYSYVAEVDYAAMRRRAERAEELLRELRHHEHRITWCACALCEGLRARVAAHFDEVKP